MYISHEKTREFENLFGYKNILDKNIEIAKYLDFKPEIEYVVGNKEGYCFSPKNCGYYSVYEQKIQAEKFMEEQKSKFPDGWVISEGNDVMKLENYSFFHNNWNELMEAIKRLKLMHKKEVHIIPEDIFETWKNVIRTIINSPHVKINNSEKRG